VAAASRGCMPRRRDGPPASLAARPEGGAATRTCALPYSPATEPIGPAGLYSGPPLCPGTAPYAIGVGGHVVPTLTWRSVQAAPSTGSRVTLWPSRCRARRWSLTGRRRCVRFS